MNKLVGIPRRDGISKTLQVERLVCEIEFKHLNKWSFELKKWSFDLQKLAIWVEEITVPFLSKINKNE